MKPTQRKDADAIPEAALRPSSDDQNYHAGRGGAGNAHLADGTKKHEGLADKLKNKLFKSKKKDEPETTTTTT